MSFRYASCLLGVVLLAANWMCGQVPAGTILPARLSNTIDTRKSRVGQHISAQIMQDVPLDSNRIPAGGISKIPRGTKLLGEIIAIQTGRVSWRFDRLVVHNQSISLRTNLRALASFTEINDAQLPTNDAGGDRGSTELDWDTVQVGGDAVYGRRGGVVMRGKDVVGHSVFGDGVLATPTAGRGSPCRGSVGTGGLQALWLFSTSACGLYGFPDVRIEHAGRSNPVGVIVLASPGRVKIRSGSGMLLRVIED